MTLFKKTTFLAAFLAIGFFAASPVISAEDEKEKDEEEEDSDETALLGAVGGLSAAFVYQTHQSIGMLSAAKEKEVYDEKACLQMLQVTINWIGGVDKQLTALTKTTIDDGDKKTIAQFHTINKLLQRQAESLKSYWDADEEEHAVKFQEYRKKSEAKINELLGIKTDGAKAADKDDEKDDDDKSEKKDKDDTKE